MSLPDSASEGAELDRALCGALPGQRVRVIVRLAAQQGQASRPPTPLGGDRVARRRAKMAANQTALAEAHGDTLSQMRSLGLQVGGATAIPFKGVEGAADAIRAARALPGVAGMWLDRPL